MKNIHVLPTDKPSRLYKNLLTNKFFILENSLMDVSECNREYQNIYITNSEEIKDGDWLLSKEGIVHNNWGWNFGDKKIILTTDPSLAPNVQKIDDEFLEWFVRNPSCEEVKVNDLYEYPNVKHIGYKIILPKEEPKQVGIDLSNFPKSTQDKVGYVDPKQETLEEFINSQPYYGSCTHEYLEGIKEGAKWQQERMYSEEEVGKLVYSIIGQYANQVNIMIDGDIIDRLFEQFKKK